VSKDRGTQNQAAGISAPVISTKSLSSSVALNVYCLETEGPACGLYALYHELSDTEEKERQKSLQFEQILPNESY